MREQRIMYSAGCASALLFVHGKDGELDGGSHTGRGFCPEFTGVFQEPPSEILREEEHDRRRSVRRGTGRKLFLGGSDPILCGLAAAQRLWRQGSLPPKGVQQNSPLRRRQNLKQQCETFES